MRHLEETNSKQCKRKAIILGCAEGSWEDRLIFSKRLKSDSRGVHHPSSSPPVWQLVPPLHPGWMRRSWASLLLTQCRKPSRPMLKLTLQLQAENRSRWGAVVGATLLPGAAAHQLGTAGSLEQHSLNLSATNKSASSLWHRHNRSLIILNFTHSVDKNVHF